LNLETGQVDVHQDEMSYIILFLLRQIQIYLFF